MIRYARIEDIPDITDVHLRALPEDLLPRLGRSYLVKEFYPQVFRCADTFTLVNEENNRVNAFCIFAGDSRALTGQVMRNKMRLAGYLAVSLVKDLRVFNEVTAILKGSRIELNAGEGDHLNAGLPEIYIIATDPQFQSRGLGREIIEKGWSILSARSPALLVRTSAERARDFYLRFGFRIFGYEFRGKRKLNLLIYQPSKSG
jgi:ribosomal protein S18 acetylase RimI-like enzyme